MDALLELTVVTNPVRSLQPHTTFAESPQPFADVDLQAVKPAILYADKVYLRTYLEDLRSFARRDASHGMMPLQRIVRSLRFVLDFEPATLRAYGFDPTLLPPKEEVRARLEDYFASNQDAPLLAALADDYGDLYPGSSHEILQGSPQFC